MTGGVGGAAMTDATSVFAEFLVGQRDAPLPARAEVAARIVMLDACGCAVSGATTSAAHSAYEMACELGGEHGSSTIVGRPRRLRSSDAAFVNTVAARALLFDDTHARGYVHAGAVMTFTALALGEALDASFGDVLRSIALGVEVAARVGAAAGETQYAAGVHTTGTVAPFGTAAVAGLLYGLSADEMRRALGLAADHAAGLRQYQVDGEGANSALHAANAARSGIASALLAREGFPAPTGMIEGSAGFLAVFRGEPDAHQLLYEGLGQEWLVTESCIKPYPNCRSAHSSATAIENLMREERLRFDDVEAIRVFVSPHGFKCDRPCPTNALDAQFSIQYTIACLLLRRDLTTADYVEEALRDPGVVALQRRITVAVEESLGKTECRMEVDLASGGSLAEVVGIGRIRGDPKNPMTVEEVGAKYLGNVRSNGAMIIAPLENLLGTLTHGPLDLPARKLAVPLSGVDAELALHEQNADAAGNQRGVVEVQ